MRAVLAIAGVVAAVAAPASGAQEPRPLGAQPAIQISLENRRDAALVSFEIVLPATEAAPEMIVGKLEKPLSAGASTSFPLIGGKGCHYQARWAFEDLKDVNEIDICNDARIVLVD